MKLDSVLDKLGHFGKYQRRIYGWLFLPMILTGVFCVLPIVELYTPKHRCKIEGLDNDTYAIQDAAHASLINKSVPVYDKDGGVQYDRCYLYQTSNHTVAAAANRTKVKCNQWVYDKSVFTHTFTVQMNLVCDDALKTAHIPMFFFLGVLIGDFVVGMLADNFGRRIGLYLGLVGTLISSFLLTWTPEFYSFTIFQFLIGAFVHGMMLCKCVISFEIVGYTKRVLVGYLDQTGFAIGVALVPLVAYLIRNWMWINLTFAVVCIPMLSLWWLVPECARWLISVGRHDEAVTVIKKTAEINNVDLREEDLCITDDKPQEKGKIWQIFSHWVLLKRTLILSFNWMIVSMTYYGVQMNAGNMGGDFFLNFLLMGLAELLGYLVGYFVTDRIGRRYSHVGSMFVGGVACLSTIFVVLFGNDDHQPLNIALAFIGKAGSAMAFAVMFIYTAELLPTVVRNASMAVCSCAARVGAMIAPYVAKSGEMIGGRFGVVEPLVVFGTLSIIAGLLILLLPETLNQKLPDTIEEGVRFGNKRKVDKEVNSEEQCITTAGNEVHI